MYLYLKAIHIIFVVSWMAGLFYIVRLFVYHTEAKQKAEPERSILFRQFELMESKLWNIITTPAMLLAVFAGLAMLYLNPALLSIGWMQVKLVFVAGLLVYHFVCQRIINQLRQQTSGWSSTGLRLWNEVATIFLVAIVFVVVLKNTIDWIYGLIGLVLFSIMIMGAVKVYKYFRSRNLQD